MPIQLSLLWQTVPEIVAANGGKARHDIVVAELQLMLARREAIGGVAEFGLFKEYKVPMFCRREQKPASPALPTESEKPY